MSKKMSEKDIGFTRGVVYVVAQLLRAGEDFHAQDIWNESGFDRADLKVCDSYDAEIVRKKIHFNPKVLLHTDKVMSTMIELKM